MDNRFNGISQEARIKRSGAEVLAGLTLAGGLVVKAISSAVDGKPIAAALELGGAAATLFQTSRSANTFVQSI